MTSPREPWGKPMEMRHGLRPASAAEVHPTTFPSPSTLPRGSELPPSALAATEGRTSVQLVGLLGRHCEIPADQVP